LTVGLGSLQHGGRRGCSGWVRDHWRDYFEGLMDFVDEAVRLEGGTRKIVADGEGGVETATLA